MMACSSSSSGSVSDKRVSLIRCEMENDAIKTTIFNVDNFMLDGLTEIEMRCIIGEQKTDLIRLKRDNECLKIGIPITRTIEKQKN